MNRQDLEEIIYFAKVCNLVERPYGITCKFQWQVLW